ncbi:MAG: tetratricopeptide repeat protein [Planctomycetaceae bacterium]
MSNDPYSPCLCGSGKKLKFCCQDILPDLQRVVKLMENQPDAAEKLLRSLCQKHPDKEVLFAQLGSLLMRQNRANEAKTVLVEFLRRHPDEPRVLLSLADICLATDGFFATRRLVHRAFQLGTRHFSEMVAMLASRIAMQMANVGLAMGVREHLALAVRMTTGERRQSLLMQLATFESQRSVPYPFRGRFALMDVSLEDDEARKEELRARRVSQIGCWEPASILYSRLCEKYPDNGALLHNLGLFQAWDGRIREAAVSLHRAAELLEDFDTAAETEALAQLLDLETTEEFYAIVQSGIPVNSVSQLLTLLDDDSRFSRTVSSEVNEAAEAGLAVVAEYELLEPTPKSSRDDRPPEVLADITVVDVVDPDVAELDSPTVWVVSQDDDNARAVEIVREVAGNLAKPVPEDTKPLTLSRLPEVCRLFDWKNFQSDAVPSSQYRSIDQQRLQQALDQWLETEQSALNNMSPLKAAEDAGNLRKVAGSVLVLDVTCNRMGYDPDLAEIRQRLGVPAPTVLRPEEDQVVTALPLFQLSRVDPQSLNDRQISEFVHRISLVRHLRLLETALDALVQRPAALEAFPPMRAHLMRASVARERNDLKLASECFAAAREAVTDDGDAFRTKLELDIREFSCRLDDPHDPDLGEILRRLRDRYFVKIPEIEGVILEELMRADRTDLISELSTVASSSGAESGLWTPGSEKRETSGSKLWVPGRD